MIIITLNSLYHCHYYYYYYYYWWGNGCDFCTFACLYTLLSVIYAFFFLPVNSQWVKESIGILKLYDKQLSCRSNETLTLNSIYSKWSQWHLQTCARRRLIVDKDTSDSELSSLTTTSASAKTCWIFLISNPLSPDETEALSISLLEQTTDSLW